ncbi:protein FAM228B isoform X1 [Empidonax traillii]|uniref:protein FAM228B isoform X1 n=2 Tax=Empidonax traillii TaxID=164674 RepID=UPI000FFD8F6F|nr:protein FAM228B isoform X1 [Empidonax traillii]XP_027753293.1 protein FAM228B isoform X1 [Empidonax traillii]
MAPLQIIPTMHSGKSSEISWLKNMTHLRPVREPDQPRPWRVTPDQSRDILASVQCILDRENCFVREVDRYLRHNDFLNLRKKEIVYKEWLKDVLEPVLQKIEDKMSSQSIEEMQKRKQEQLSQYLNYCKKKGYVFLDHFDPSEYDPFSQKMCTDCWKDGSHQSPQ